MSDRDLLVEIGRLRAALAAANEELATWRSVFPDIVPTSVVPTTETMLRQAGNDALERAAEVVRALLPFEANTGDRQRFSHHDIETYRKGALRLVITDIEALKTKEPNHADR